MVHHIRFHTTGHADVDRRPPGLYRPSHEITHIAPRRHKTWIRTPVRSEYVVAPHTPRLGRGPADTLPELPRRPGTVSSQGWNRSVRLRHHASHTSLRILRHNSFHTAAGQAVRAACVGRPLYKNEKLTATVHFDTIVDKLTFMAGQCPKTHANPRNPADKCIQRTPPPFSRRPVSLSRVAPLRHSDASAGPQLCRSDRAPMPCGLRQGQQTRCMPR